MRSRAIISFDWGKPRVVQEQQQLIAATIQSGWLLAETTAFSIEADDLDAIWSGLGLVARSSNQAGTLTSLNFNIVSSDDFTMSRPYAAATNHKNAVTDVLKRPFPG